MQYNNIQDDAEINNSFPNLPISEGKDGAHFAENNQNAEYNRGTEGQKGGDSSGDGKDGGAEGGKRDDTAEKNHGEDDDLWEESSDQETNLPISESKVGAHSTENYQQFSHKDVGASEARFIAEYERGTAGEEGDDSGDGKDGGTEGGKGDESGGKNHEEDEEAAKEPSCSFNRCNWAQEVNCNLPELAPMKFKKNDCDKLIHYLCYSEWEQREGHIHTVAMYCCLHHPNYIDKTQSETNDGSQGTERIDST